MPREQIVSSELPYGPDEPAISVIDISWSREAQYVQLGCKCIRSDDGSDYFPRLEPIEVEPIMDGEETVGFHPTELIEAEGLRSNGWFVQLDRDGCNQLIRVIRRARNAAFGADE